MVAATRPTGAGAPGVPPGSALLVQMQRVSGRQVSRGHAEQFDAVVWANEPARAAWDGAGDMPDGAVLVEEAMDRAARGDRTVGLLVMEKRAGAWAFRIVGADGRVVEGARVDACAACHHDAPRDDVFRPAPGDPKAQSSSSPTSAPMTAIAPTAVATTAATHEARSAGSAPAPSSR